MSTSVQAENVQTRFTPTTSASFLQQIFGILLNFSPILPVRRPVLQLSPGPVDYFQGPAGGGTGGTTKGTSYCSDISRWGSQFWQCKDLFLNLLS